jgi:hypothetical protein
VEQAGRDGRSLLEVEVLQALAVGEVGVLEPPLGAALTALVELEVEQAGQGVAVRLPVAGGLVGQLGEAGAHGGQVELPGLGADQSVGGGGGRVHARPPWSSSS